VAHSAESPGGGVDLRDAASRHQSAALATVCAVLFVTFLDNTVVSVTLADIQSRLHAGVTSLQWVVDGYALLFAALMLTGGTALRAACASPATSGTTSISRRSGRASGRTCQSW
jgi:MFS family permease